MASPECLRNRRLEVRILWGVLFNSILAKRLRASSPAATFSVSHQNPVVTGSSRVAFFGNSLCVSGIDRERLTVCPCNPRLEVRILWGVIFVYFRALDLRTDRLEDQEAY